VIEVAPAIGGRQVTEVKQLPGVGNAIPVGVGAGPDSVGLDEGQGVAALALN
jgi:hypothetical protein